MTEKRVSRAKQPLRNLRILVFDNAAPDTRELLRSMLKESGASVVVAQSVDAALEMYRQHPPHVLVADITLGYSNGYGLIQEIREHNIEYRGFTAAIAITASASPEDEERAIAAGFNAYLAKPFTQVDIVNTVVQVWRDSHKLAA
jgi:CheY-like chemotaxis protein